MIATGKNFLTHADLCDKVTVKSFLKSYNTDKEKNTPPIYMIKEKIL